MPRIVTLPSTAKIYIYADDHNPPHFHLVGPDTNANILIETFDVYEGRATRKALQEARDWWRNETNRQMLGMKWNELGPVLSCDELFTERIRIKGGTLFFGGFPNQLLTDSWAVGSRRADRWSALDYATTNGNGSRMFCLDVKGTWVARRKIIDCSSKRFSTDLELGVRGVIYRNVSAPGKRSINVSADGRRAGFSSAFSSY